MLETFKVKAIHKESTKVREMTISFLLSKNDVKKFLKNDRQITEEEYDLDIQQIGAFIEKDGMYEFSEKTKKEEEDLERLYSKLRKKYFELTKIVN